MVYISILKLCFSLQILAAVYTLHINKYFCIRTGRCDAYASNSPSASEWLKHKNFEFFVYRYPAAELKNVFSLAWSLDNTHISMSRWRTQRFFVMWLCIKRAMAESQPVPFYSCSSKRHAPDSGPRCQWVWWEHGLDCRHRPTNDGILSLLLLLLCYGITIHDAWLWYRCYSDWMRTCINL